MSRRSQKVEEKSEMELAQEAALKEAEAAKAAQEEQQKQEEVKPEEKQEEQKQEEEIPADACEVWGQCDLNSRACKSCPVFELCKVKTEAMKPQKAKRSSSGTSPKVKRADQEGLSKFNLARIGTRSSDLDFALEDWKTMNELAAIFTLTVVKSHIKWLETKRADRCHKETDAEGRIRFVLNEQK